jgi:titin
MPQSSEVSPTSVTLTWTKPDRDGGSPLTGYTIEYKIDGQSGWKAVDDLRLPVVFTSFTVTNLQPSTGYRFRIFAHNKIGPSEPSSDSSLVKTSAQAEPPGPVRALQITDVDKTSVSLSWTPPSSDGGSELTGYVIEKRATGSVRWSAAGKVDAGRQKFTVVDLIEGGITVEHKLQNMPQHRRNIPTSCECRESNRSGQTDRHDRRDSEE